MTPLANEIRKRAADLGLSHTEIARRSGIGERAFQHYLGGRSEPGLAALVRIADVLECTPNDLLGLADDGTDSQDKASRLRRQIARVCARLDRHALALVFDLAKSIEKWRSRSP